MSESDCSFLFVCQIILSTNIAESSVTVPDVKYGEVPVSPSMAGAVVACASLGRPLPVAVSSCSGGAGSMLASEHVRPFTWAASGHGYLHRK